ncbi:MAG: hypothetical protein ABIW30_07505 [Arenimonas sp.]
MNSHDTDHDARVDPAGLSRARELFEHSVQRIDPATATRLRHMRRELLSGPQRTTRPWLIPAAATMSALLILAMTHWLPAASTSAAPAPETIAVDDSVFAADEDAELYAWLGEGPVAVGNAGGGKL